MKSVRFLLSSQRLYNPKHCQQFYTPENFQEMFWSWLRSGVIWFTFVKPILRGDSARLVKCAELITFSVLATSIHYINGGATSTFTSSTLFLPFLALFSCFSSALQLQRQCRNKKNVISWNMSPCIPLKVN